MENEAITILGKPITFKRLTLRGWSQLENLKKSMDDAVLGKDFDKYYICLVQFIETSMSPFREIEWKVVPWYEAITAYSEAVKLNLPTLEFPILASTKAENKKLPWEYDGRQWYFWLHILASNYGWDEYKIGDTDIDTALGLYQEILLEEQLDKEWTYSLSEIAFPYNSSTKKSEYKPLDRPEWMLPISPKQLPVIKMRKEMMPVGNIIDMTEKPKKDIHGI